MTVRVKLSNGLYATIRKLSDLHSKPAADALQRRFHTDSSSDRFYHVVSIRLKGEMVYLVVPRQNKDKPVKILAAMLAHGLTHTLGYVPYIIHDGACHAYGEPAANIICTAIVNRRKPSVQALLCDPKELRRRW
jgi:hypothetical protein